MADTSRGIGIRWLHWFGEWGLVYDELKRRRAVRASGILRQRGAR